MIIDTHVHLDDSRFDDDIDEVIQNAKNKNIKQFIIPSADPKDLNKAFNISEKNDSVFFAIGTHPYHCSDEEVHLMNSHFENLKFTENNKFIAVGECGLDYYRLSKESENTIEREKIKEQQKKVFIEQIRLAKKLKKPLIVHIRDASEDAKKILIEEKASEVGGVLHCFNADETLLELKNHNFYFGIGGVVTFKNAKKLVNILPKIPLKNILLETDAPYLTPAPHRGKRNEPAYTQFVAQKVAEILNLQQHEIEEITTQNAKKLFKI
jgi:TatD DNase family protein